MNERIKEIMAKAFGVPVEQITEKSNQDTIENWDSLRHLQLIVFLEREFDIIIPDEIVGNLISFKLIEATIQKCHGESA